MFETHMKYGIDERGPYSQSGLDVNSLIEFLKAELASQPKTATPQDTAAAAPVNLPLPGSNTVPTRVPFNIPDVLPERSQGYTSALKDIIGRFGQKFV